MPVNIHGQNWLWISNAALSKAGASEPHQLGRVFAALDKLKAAGLIPLAFSGQKNWERNLFNAVLVGKGGTRLFDSHSTASAIRPRSRAPTFKTVAETYRKAARPMSIRAARAATGTTPPAW